jgi:hypothetical protein
MWTTSVGNFQTTAQSKQRPILYLTFGQTLTQGAKLSPLGWIWGGGEVITWGEILCIFAPPFFYTVCMYVCRECSPQGVNKGVKFPPRGQFHHWGPSSPLWVKFTPGGQGWSFSNKWLPGLGWGANPGTFDSVYFLIPSLYRWASAASRQGEV